MQKASIICVVYVKCCQIHSKDFYILQTAVRTVYIREVFKTATRQTKNVIGNCIHFKYLNIKKTQRCVGIYTYMIEGHVLESM